MTNFQPLEDKIWEAVKSDDRAAFEEGCKALMEKVASDIWRLGWEIYPKKIEDVYDFLDEISKWCHERWVEDMQRGDAPNEDMSPGEGPLLVKKIIQEEIAKCGKEGANSGDSQDMVQD